MCNHMRKGPRRAAALGERSEEAVKRLHMLASDLVIPLAQPGEIERLSAVCNEKLARP